MTGQKGWAFFASFVLALVGLPAVAHAQGPEDAKMTPSPLDTGGRSLADFLAQGKEWEVTLGSASPEARDTISRWAAGGKLDKLEMYTLPGGRVFFEAHISKGGRSFEVLVASDGQTVAQGSNVAD
ncbi:hypothetical protein [Polyangium sp. y55x31]|uniref:hypothetical protein n=1 Tax=Polyangium sp. y55x31 TaxID=3042688 RepID=UPI002482A338|nr:hypothetical protein [Polyangium sp. y55x31]MDI1480346.1 hypothetical protein [Polyangium sp. y55x31]